MPPDISDQLRVEAVIAGNAVTIVERRPPLGEDFGPDWSSVGVARLRYSAKAGTWTLYSADSNGRWHQYEFLGPASDVHAVLREVDRDPTGIFWG